MRDDPTAPAGGPHVEAWLDAYRTGELEEPDRVRIERHLARCPECAGRLGEIAALARALHQAYAAAPRLAALPDWVRQRREILDRTVGPSRRVVRPGRLPRFAPQAALAILALIVLGVLVREGVRGPADLQRRLEKEGRTASPAPSGAPAEGRQVPAPPAQSELPGAPGPPVAGVEVPPDADESAPPLEQAAPALNDRLEERERQASRSVLAKPSPSEVGNTDSKLRRDAAVGDAVVRPTEEAPGPPGESGRVAAKRVAPSPAGARKRGEQAAGAAANEAGFAGEPAPSPGAPSADRAVVEGRTAPLGAEARGPASGEMDALQRLDLYSRKALASGDEGDAARALAFWRDSVASRSDLDPARKRAAAALVDSLARRAEGVRGTTE